MKKLLACLSLVFSMNLFAVDIPEDVIGSENLKNENCEGTTADTCIQNICSSDPEPSCPDDCRKKAKQACAAKTNE